jgi:hypothetical protein
MKRRVACWLCSGSRSSTVLCARCKALSTEAGVVSSASAVSWAEKPSTSRRISTGALPRGQMLERRDEGQLDALTLLVSIAFKQKCTGSIGARARSSQSDERGNEHRTDQQRADHLAGRPADLVATHQPPDEAEGTAREREARRSSAVPGPKLSFIRASTSGTAPRPGGRWQPPNR